MTTCARWFPSGEGFVRREAVLPAPFAGEILIDVAAFGINRLDLERARRPGALRADETVGLEVAGTVAALGPGTPEFKIGDRVMALVAENGYADRVIAPARTALAMPDGLSFEQGAALPEALFTAWLNLVELGRLKAGESVLIHHATGGVGIVGAQLVRALGASVRVTTGKPENLKKLGELGIAGSTTAEFDRAPDAGGDVDLILDIRGAASLEANLRLLRTGGRLVLIDSYSGEKARLDIGRLLDNSLSVHGSLLQPRTLEQKGATAAGIRAGALAHVASGKIAPPIDRVLGPGELASAHVRLASNAHFGKLVVSLGKSGRR